MNIKEQIRAEIERRLSWRITLEARSAYNNILRFLDTLPEQPVGGLEEEVKRYYADNFDYISSEQPTLSILTNIARHFAEWGAEHLKR
jgi:hypothetical protein